MASQERRVIVVSTVRSSIEHIEFDLKHTLGFVANPRRFNGIFQKKKSNKSVCLCMTFFQ